MIQKSTLVWKSLLALPESIRGALLRRLVHFPSEMPTGIRFKIAETQDELEQAFSLLHDAYVHEGLMKPQPSGLRVTKYHALPSTTTLIAVQGATVVGTVSLVRQNQFGLPLEAIFNLDHLPPGSRPAEVSSLAIRTGFRSQRGNILFPLLRFCYQYAVEYFGVTHFLIAVNPKWYTFYEAILGFSRLANKTVESYDFVNGAPAIGGYMDLKAGARALEVRYGKNPPHRNLSRFFNELEPINMEFPLRKRGVISDPVLSPELLDYFFVQKSQVFENLSDFERLILRELYNSSEFLKVIPKSKVVPLWTRHEKRYDANLRARITLADGRVVPVEIQCVSKSGVGGVASIELPPGRYVIEVDAEDYEPCVISGEVQWMNPRRRFGFSMNRQVTSESGDDLVRWSSFIGRIEDRLMRKRSSSDSERHEIKEAKVELATKPSRLVKV